MTKTTCKYCGKEFEEKKGIYLFKLWSPQRIIIDKWHVCSSKCLEDFVSVVKTKAASCELEVFDDLQTGIPFVVKQLLLSPQNSRLLSNDVSKWRDQFEVIFAPLEEVDRNPRGNLLWHKLQEGIKDYVQFTHIPNMIIARRFEEAAKIYEKRGMFEEAGRLRERDKEIIVRKTEIKLDLNVLLKQIADGGIVAIYRCPNCGGKLKIGKNTTVASLSVCEHCQSEIATMDIADFLKTALS